MSENQSNYQDFDDWYEWTSVNWSKMTNREWLQAAWEEGTRHSNCKNRGKLKLFNEMLDTLVQLRVNMSSECAGEGCTCGDGWEHDDIEGITKIDELIARATRKRGARA